MFRQECPGEWVKMAVLAHPVHRANQDQTDCLDSPAILANRDVLGCVAKGSRGQKDQMDHQGHPGNREKLERKFLRI